MLTLERAEELFVYDGVNLLWKVDRCRIKAGTIAGTITTRGYREVKTGGSVYGVHRVIWLLVHKVWPVYDIDHIQEYKADNRISELAHVSKSGNHKNRKLATNNTSGRVGVSIHTSGKWSASIYNGFKVVHLGLFHHKDDAIKARSTAETYYGYHTNHGRPK